IQRRNQQTLRDILTQVPEISFRSVPDPSGDSGTFLSWFLPSAEVTQAVIEGFRAAGILPGNFYWFNNNWHYVRKWHPLKEGNSLYPLNAEQRDALEVIRHQDFSVSDTVMSRCISPAISLSWTDAQLREKGAAMVAVIQSVLAATTTTA